MHGCRVKIHPSKLERTRVRFEKNTRDSRENYTAGSLKHGWSEREERERERESRVNAASRGGELTTPRNASTKEKSEGPNDQDTQESRRRRGQT